MSGSETGRRSRAVAVALLTSRILGLVRSRVVAHYSGSSQAADIVAGVLRGGNQLQNLLGEQALSASFIPIYSKFLGEERQEDARRFAGCLPAVFRPGRPGMALRASGAGQAEADRR